MIKDEFYRLKFDDANEMKTLIESGFDLFNIATGEYVFLYNENQDFCSYILTLDEALEYCSKAKEYDEYWGAFLGVGGTIIGDTANYCEDRFKDTNWIETDYYDKFLIELLVTKKYENEFIYPITVMTDIVNKNGFCYCSSGQQVGIYYKKEDAIETVVENCGDINEHTYNYALVEEIPYGVYPTAHNRWWYKFNYNTCKYEQIFSMEDGNEPEFIKRMA